MVMPGIALLLLVGSVLTGTDPPNSATELDLPGTWAKQADEPQVENIVPAASFTVPLPAASSPGDAEPRVAGRMPVRELPGSIQSDLESWTAGDPDALTFWPLSGGDDSADEIETSRRIASRPSNAAAHRSIDASPGSHA